MKKEKNNSNFNRNCPQCNKEIFYKSKRNFTNALKKNILCISCARLKNSKPKKFTRKIFKMKIIIVTVGIPSSGKSTWAKQKVAEDPNNYCRINNDEIRNMCNYTVYSPEYEKLISKFRSNMISTALKFNKNVIVDNVNADKKHFKEICKLAQDANVDIKVYEKIFYIDLEEAVLRDSKRLGKECVGREVITGFWRKLGKENFQNYQPKEQVFYKRNTTSEKIVEPMIQDENLPKAVICDLDGSIALLNGRNPYDASMCDNDLPNEFIVRLLNLYYNNNHKLIFCSGREDKYKDQTNKFLSKYLPNHNYELFMRKTGDFRSDDEIKEEIFNNHIKNKYFVEVVLDDRLKVCRLWHKLGLNLLRIGDPDASF